MRGERPQQWKHEKKVCINSSAATWPDIFVCISFETGCKCLQILICRILLRSFKVYKKLWKKNNFLTFIQILFLEQWLLYY